MKLSSLYSEKKSTVEQAINVISPGDEIVIPLGAGEPASLLKALYNYEKLKGNRLYQLLSLREMQAIDPEKLEVVSMFLGASEREFYAKGKINLLPNHFSNVPRILKNRLKSPIVMARVAPIDEEGYFSLGTNSEYTTSVLQYAKYILVEVNENMPRTFGTNRIHISKVDKIVEDNAPLPQLLPPEITENDLTIGKLVMNLIQDGDTVQIGIGAVPSVVMDYLQHYKNLGFYSEMLPDKFVDLCESGALTNSNKLIFQNISTATFVLGSKRLYDYIDNNEQLLMLPVNESNDIRQISKLDQFVSINSTIEIDLIGQCNSEVVSGNYYSSTGGQGDFTRAVSFCENGRGIICLHSTTRDLSISKIVPTLSNNAVVTTCKNDVDYVVTEFGIAHLKNKTISERAKALIKIAHPKFREELTFAAKQIGYL